MLREKKYQESWRECILKRIYLEEIYLEEIYLWVIAFGTEQGVLNPSTNSSSSLALKFSNKSSQRDDYEVVLCRDQENKTKGWVSWGKPCRMRFLSITLWKIIKGVNEIRSVRTFDSKSILTLNVLQDSHPSSPYSSFLSVMMIAKRFPCLHVRDWKPDWVALSVFVWQWEGNLLLKHASFNACTMHVPVILREESERERSTKIHQSNDDEAILICSWREVAMRGKETEEKEKKANEETEARNDWLNKNCKTGRTCGERSTRSTRIGQTHRFITLSLLDKSLGKEHFWRMALFLCMPVVKMQGKDASEAVVMSWKQRSRWRMAVNESWSHRPAKCFMGDKSWSWRREKQEASVEPVLSLLRQQLQHLLLQVKQAIITFLKRVQSYPMTKE